MMKNNKVHPVAATLDYPDGSKEFIIEHGETYFQRCAREFTAAAIINGRVFESKEHLVAQAIQFAMELERQLDILQDLNKKA